MAVYNWASAKSGSWNTALKWSPGGGPAVLTGVNGPYSMDSAVFATGSHRAYTVSGNAVANGLTVTGDHVTFQDFKLGNAFGASMTVTGGAYVTISADSVIGLGSHDGAGGTLTIDDSTVVVYGGTGGSGAILKDGAQLIASGVSQYPQLSFEIENSVDASSSITIENGAKFITRGDGIAGQLNVTGAGSTTTVIDAFAGTLNVSSAATVTSGEIDGTAKLSGGSLSLTAVGAGGMISGNGTITSAFTNAGTVTAHGGTLTLAGAVTGAGTLAMGAHATLVLDESTDETVRFTGADARLMLAPNATATGFLTGFGRGDSIDIGGAAISRVTETAQGGNTVLQAFAGSTMVDSFTVAGRIADGAIKLASDHAGGTVLTYDPSHGGYGGFPGGGWHGC